MSLMRFLLLVMVLICALEVMWSVRLWALPIVRLLDMRVLMALANRKDETLPSSSLVKRYLLLQKGWLRRSLAHLDVMPMLSRPYAFLATWLLAALFS